LDREQGRSWIDDPINEARIGLHRVTVFAQTAQTAQKGTTAPDNTGTNARDRDRNHPTADQQKNNQGDLKITQDIRRSIVKDKSLSTYAHNVKIITQNGNVTLRGTVRSEEEKAAVEAKANEVVGEGHVKSEIGIAPKKVRRKPANVLQPTEKE